MDCGLCAGEVCVRCHTCTDCRWDSTLRRTSNAHGSCLNYWLDRTNRLNEED